MNFVRAFELEMFWLDQSNHSTLVSSMPTSTSGINRRRVLSPEERAAASAVRADTKARYEAAILECFVKLDEMADRIATEFSRKKESVLMDIHGGVKEKKERKASAWKVFFKEFSKTANSGKSVGEKTRFEDLVQDAAKAYAALSNDEKAVILENHEARSTAALTATRVSSLSKIRDVQHTVVAINKRVSTLPLVLCRHLIDMFKLNALSSRTGSHYILAVFRGNVSYNMSPVTNVSQIALLDFFLSRFNIDFSHLMLQLESYALSGGTVMGAISSYKENVKLLKRQSTSVILKGLRE